MQYSEGTVTINNGSTSVTGTNTRWLSHADENYIIIIDNDDDFYEINEVTDDTTLVLNSAYTGVNKINVSYVIVKDYTTHYKWPLITKGAANWPTILSETFNRIDRDLYMMSMDKTIKYIQFEPLAAFPDTPEEGSMYYNSTLHTLLVYSSGSWRTVTLTPI